MIEEIKKHIRDVPNFPKEGILFKDITTALKDAACFRQIIDAFYKAFKDKKIDKIAGVESRGYLIGSALAYKLGCGLVLLRKPGKLPSQVIREDYDLEYGRAALEIHTDSIEPGERVLIVDDLLATGGTGQAACKLVQRLGGKVVATTFLIELKALQGRKALEEYGETVSIITY